jgi:hypothetical protein
VRRFFFSKRPLDSLDPDPGVAWPPAHLLPAIYMALTAVDLPLACAMRGLVHRRIVPVISDCSLWLMAGASLGAAG